MNRPAFEGETVMPSPRLEVSLTAWGCSPLPLVRGQEPVEYTI